MKGTSRFFVGLTLTVSLLTCGALAQSTTDQPTPPPADQPMTPPADQPMDMTEDQPVEPTEDMPEDMPEDPAVTPAAAPMSSEMNMSMMARADMSKTFGFTDKNFSMKMHMGNIYEILAAQIALTKSSSDAVKAFAEQMILDHSNMDIELLNTVKTLNPNYVLVDEISGEQQRLLDRLSAATIDFDAEYKAQMIESHQQTLDLVEKYLASKYGNTVLKGVAQGATPVVEMHLQMAQALTL